MVVSGNGNGNPFQYSCLENPLDRGAWWAAVHGIAESHTRHECMHWRRKWQPTPVFSPGELQAQRSMVGRGGLPSMGSHRVRHDWWLSSSSSIWLLEGLNMQIPYNHAWLISMLLLLFLLVLTSDAYRNLMTPLDVRYSYSHCLQFPTLTTGFQDEF